GRGERTLPSSSPAGNLSGGPPSSKFHGWGPPSSKFHGWGPSQLEFPRVNSPAGNRPSRPLLLLERLLSALRARALATPTHRHLRETSRRATSRRRRVRRARLLAKPNGQLAQEARQLPRKADPLPRTKRPSTR